MPITEQRGESPIPKKRDSREELVELYDFLCLCEGMESAFSVGLQVTIRDMKYWLKKELSK
jgi:hypothetical protein